MAFLELKNTEKPAKTRFASRGWSFLGINPLPSTPKAISQADQLLDYKSWSEEDRKMFSQLRMREEQALLAQDYALEQAEERELERGKVEGREEGKLFAFLDMARQCLLTS